MTDPSKIRAYLYARRFEFKLNNPPQTVWYTWYPSSRPAVKSWLQWHMEVTDGEKVIHTDDCRDLWKLYDEAMKSVASFRTRARNGETFQSWSRQVEEAGDA